MAEKKKKSAVKDSSISAMLKKLLPGGLSKALLSDANVKLKKAAKK
jgi:hypothetical protein